MKHYIFQPSPDNPLDFEQTVERTLLELCRAFYVRQMFYDPYQLVAVAQRLQKARVPMVEFPQSVGNLTEASSNLYDLIQGRNLTVYPDAALRLAVSRAVAVESGRGWRITKEKASHKIDVVVALAQAALGAAKQEGRSQTTFARSSALRRRSLRGALVAKLVCASKERFLFRACASRTSAQRRCRKFSHRISSREKFEACD